MSKRKKYKFALKEVVAFATGGAAAGAGFSSMIGGMGLAVGGTAFSIGIAPVAAAGTVIGLAAYGLKKAVKK
ncbi:hypothetical protein K9N68_24600 [Kovacikia minuta CCNUW1]|uniref:hypothetical protein n=1 Tax=Kovacikia minuta TaxID=2931930 RepID=UPI001CCBE0B4|nr:hypothetical protein [Kovacikia minuta]UBF24812.1 hypothetical protein K9N68_24600 [Kovacikia minuta CCNUW1]